MRALRAWTQSDARCVLLLWLLQLAGQLQLKHADAQRAPQSMHVLQVQHLAPGDHAVPLASALGTWRQRGVFAAADWHRVPHQLPLAAAATLCVKCAHCRAARHYRMYCTVVPGMHRLHARCGCSDLHHRLVLPLIAVAVTQCSPPTALCMLESVVQLRPGDTVVQNGATSAVGQHVIQLARTMGLHTINVIRDRPDWDSTVAWLQGMGADLVTTEQRLKHDFGVTN